MSSTKKKINIVMFNMSSYSEWEKGVQNRNFHILQTLLNDDRIGKILTVDYLPFNFQRAIRNFKENIFCRTGYKIIWRTIFSRALEINGRLLVYSSVLSYFSHVKFYAELKQFIDKQGLRDYIIWSYYPLDIDYFFKLEGRLNIFDAVDNWAEHPSYKKEAKLLLDNYKIINEKADIIFTVANELESLFPNNHKVYWFPNGVDLKHYQQEYPIVNRDIGSLGKPIVGYIGTVQDRFDLDLFEYLSKQNPEKSFVVIGPIWYKQIKERLHKLKNVYCLGRKTYQEIPMYLQQFDAGIIPHKIDRFIHFTNPMKMYEYLACGKPVVSTSGAGVDLFSEYVNITNDYRQFNLYLNQAIKDNNQNLIKERLEAIKDHSWLKRADKMLDLIQQKLRN